ncbi:MAG: response regulator, partial [Oscillospiraceae bacterium]|nr:response regulator [Oscillospiraceae bacterium]
AGQMMADFTATGTYSAKYRVRHKNGRWIWIHDYGTLVRTPQGEELVYSLIQNIDAEERLTKQLVTERQNYQDALTKGSMYHYTIDLTDGYYRREIYSHDGLPMFESLGIALPAAYNDQASLFIGMGFEPLDSMGELATSREKILELFESGCTQFEYHIRYSVDDTYSRVMVLMHRTEEKGHVIATFIHHDETEQKRAENMRLKQERLTTEIIHALSGDYENVYIVNTEDMTVDVRKIGGEPYANIPYGQATLFPYDESWRHYIDIFVHPDDAEALYEARNIDRVIEKLETGSEYTYTFRTIRSKMRYLQFKFIRLDEKRIIAGLRNISSIVEEENKQRELLEDALRSAEHANRSKTIFLSSMSHDIRTPMNAIIGFTSLALNNLSDSDRVRDYLQKIQTSSKHLHALFDEVLDMSRIDSGKVTIEESQVNLPELVQSVYDIVQADIRSKNLSVSVLSENIRDENVWCDRLRLNQILINCVSNAIKYTPPYGAVTVSIDQLESEKNGYALYEFRVRDTGIGMSEEFIEHIYEPFAREQTSTVSGIPGTGLGMTISKRFVDMMGGTIEVKSEKNVGTEFIIRVSFRIVTSEAVTNPIMQLGTAPEENGKGIQGLRILLVEDNELNREIASEILKEQGAFIEMAGDGSAAVDIITNSKAGQFDLILMDIQMPIMNGYEATRRIRALPDREKADIPIIALSANAFEEDRRKSMEEGANAHIPKPINVEELTEV